MRWRNRAVAASGLTAAMLLASCGDSPFSAAGNDLTEAERSRMAEAFVDCMAEGGLEASVDYSSGGLDIGVDLGEGIDEAAALEIEAGCEHHLNELENDGPQMSPDEEAELADAMVDVQRCLADAGFVVEISADGIGLDSNTDDNGGEQFDEASYLEAEDACFREVVPELYERYGESG